MSETRWHSKCERYTERYADGECQYCSRRRKHNRRAKPKTMTYVDEGWEVTITMKKIREA